MSHPIQPYLFALVCSLYNEEFTAAAASPITRKLIGTLDRELLNYSRHNSEAKCKEEGRYI